VKKKYRFSQATWEALGADDRLVEAIENEKARRVRDGSAKREKAQQFVTAAPDVLNTIMTDPKASPKHKIDSCRVLDQFAANGPQAASEADRFVISINLGADCKLTFDKKIAVDPNDNAIIDTTATDLAVIAQREDNSGGPV
jgi:hypothetical protein